MLTVGLYGKPSTGKSTFFSAVTKKVVTIAEHPFSTTTSDEGIAYVSDTCPCTEFSITCNPANGTYCQSGTRFVPIKIIDVPGVIGGAHAGKGLGKQSLSALNKVDGLIYLLDLTREDCIEDFELLKNEYILWVTNILNKNWRGISKEVAGMRRPLDLVIQTHLNTFNIDPRYVKIMLEDLPRNPYDWTGNTIKLFSERIWAKKKYVIAANKADLCLDQLGVIEALQKKYGRKVLPVSSLSELILIRRQETGDVRYVRGSNNFTVLKNRDEELSRIERTMAVLGGTGVQACLNNLVFDELEQILAYPVENIDRLDDSRGRVLPGPYLMPQHSTLADFARRVHTEISEGLLFGVDARHRRRIGKQTPLQQNDIIKLVHTRKKGK